MVLRVQNDAFNQNALGRGISNLGIALFGTPESRARERQFAADEEERRLRREERNREFEFGKEKFGEQTRQFGLTLGEQIESRKQRGTEHAATLAETTAGRVDANTRALAQLEESRATRRDRAAQFEAEMKHKEAVLGQSKAQTQLERDKWILEEDRKERQLADTLATSEVGRRKTEEEIAAARRAADYGEAWSGALPGVPAIDTGPLRIAEDFERRTSNMAPLAAPSVEQPIVADPRRRPGAEAPEPGPAYERGATSSLTGAFTIPAAARTSPPLVEAPPSPAAAPAAPGTVTPRQRVEQALALMTPEERSLVESQPPDKRAAVAKEIIMRKTKPASEKIGEKQAEIDRYVARGIPIPRAEAIAYGNIKITNPDAAGNIYEVNTETGEKGVPVAGPEYERQRGAVQSGAGPGGPAPPMTPTQSLERAAERSTGIVPGLANLYASTAGAILPGAQAPQTAEAIQQVELFNNQARSVIAAINQGKPGNLAVKEQEWVNRVLPEPGKWFTDPTEQRNKVTMFRNYLWQKSGEIDRDLEAPGLTVEKQKQLKDNKQAINALIRSMGNSREGMTPRQPAPSPAPSPGGAMAATPPASQPLTATNPQTRQKIISNDGGMTWQEAPQ